MFIFEINASYQINDCFSRDESEPEMIPDINAIKPLGWLEEEPELIPDDKAVKPPDW